MGSSFKKRPSVSFLEPSRGLWCFGWALKLALGRQETGKSETLGLAQPEIASVTGNACAPQWVEEREQSNACTVGQCAGWVGNRVHACVGGIVKADTLESYLF